MKTIVNSGFYQFLGTDKFENYEDNLGEDYRRYREKWNSWPEEMVLGDFPLHLDLEATNICNLECDMCVRNVMTEKTGLMSWDLFTKIIDESAINNLASIKLNRRGEPLHHPKLPKMIKYAKDKGILDVQFNSNAMLLTEKLSVNLIDSGLDRIIFSLDGVTKDTFEKIRGGANFEKVVSNIKTFVDIRNKMGRKKPQVRIQMVKMDQNSHEVAEFIKTWSEIVNRVAVNTRREPYIKGEKNQKDQDQFPCAQIWQRMNVWWSGEVTMCCGDWHGEYTLGNAFESTIHELWHSKKYNHVRNLHRNDEFKKIPICARCEFNTARYDANLQKMLEKHMT